MIETGTLALMTLASFEAVTPLPLAAQMWTSSREAARRLFDVVDAIVGPSGAGKSTIANLLLRFWDYESGEITLGGKSLKALNQDEVRKRCAIVAQNSHFFSTTIRENLRLAHPSMRWEEMESAARAAHIHEFIAGLPKGYDTFIGEQGLRLSGGERQRLAIARALLKDAPILVFDEPTANLDPLTEQQVLTTLFETMRGKTFLLITHRLVGLENVDEILVMEQGKIVERGNHYSLLAQDGLYRRLWDLQNKILFFDQALQTHPVSHKFESFV